MLRKLFRARVLLGLPMLLTILVVVAACAAADTPTPIVIEKEVIKEVEVPVVVEKEVVKEVVVEVPVIVEKEVVVEKEVRVEVPVVVEKEVIKEVVVEVPVIVEKEVIVVVTPTPTPPSVQLQSYLYTGPMPSSFQEPPALAALVDAGRLPPLSLRLPEDPLVVVPPDEIGQYGGTIRYARIGPGDIVVGAQWYDSLIILNSWDGGDIEPNIAKSWSLSTDGKTYTFNLRKGMKWSDGAPFGAHDYKWAWDNLILNDEYSPSKPGVYRCATYGPGAGACPLAEFRVVDPVTIQYAFAQPAYTFIRLSANQARGSWWGSHGYAPGHYMKQFHPNFTSKAELDKMIADEGVDDWTRLFRGHYGQWKDVNFPVVGPRTTANEEKLAQLWRTTRNPYFFEVDPEGNQLPYIDDWVGQLTGNEEILNLMAIGGQFDYQQTGTFINKLPLYAANAERADFRILFWNRTQDGAVWVNQTFDADPTIAKWLQNRDFRRAIAYALDRDELNAVVWHGTGEVRDAVPKRNDPNYPGPDYENKYTEFNRSKANDLLDKIGLDKKDAEGLRIDPATGTRLQIILFSDAGGRFPYPDLAELMVEQLQSVGLGIVLKIGRPTEMNEIQLRVGNMAFRPDPWQNGELTPCCSKNIPFAPLVGRWFVSGGTEGIDPATKPHLEPLDKIMDLWFQALTIPDSQRVPLGQEIYRITVDNLHIIGTVGNAAGWNVVIVKNNLINVPNDRGPGNMRWELMSFKQD